MRRLISVLLVMIVLFMVASSISFAQQKSPKRPRFYIGFDKTMLSGIEIKNATAALEILTKEIARKEGYNSKSFFYNNSAELFADITKGTLDAGSTPPLDFLRNKEALNVKPAYGGTINGQVFHKYLLLVRSNSGTTTVHDLKGKRLAMAKGDDVGMLYLNTLLLKDTHREATDYFSEIASKNKFPAAVLAVFFGQADACIVPQEIFQAMGELNPQVIKKLTPIAVSEDFLIGLTFFRADFDELHKQTIANRAESIQYTAHGKQMLLLFKIGGIQRIDDSALDSLERLMKEYDRLKKK